jgi:hypothetical protein
MGTISMKVDLWDDKQDPAAGPPVASRVFSQPAKIAVAGVAPEVLAGRIEKVLAEQVTGWVEQYVNGRNASQAILPPLQTVVTKIAGG